jgi:Asp-tRNA(Asn)/Glu-tRNA(Gln) amidotransferase A subunit family amidase
VRLAVTLVFGVGALVAPIRNPSVASAATPGTSFQWVEATIEDVRLALESGSLDCESLVSGYLQRIAAYDDQGPALRSVITVHAQAVGKARALDDAYASAGPVGPLHCVPILLKDNIDTFDLPTTAGSRSLEGAQPPDDAFVVARLRAAGALVLGKANMDEFAMGFGGSSSLGGTVRNPYDPARGPGGSSSGTAAAVAASLSLTGLGTDTGGSIRVPSSAQGLIGIRPSLRLISQDGVLPLAHFQDTVGPMCRTVEDCAALLDAMVGFDPSSLSGQNTEPLQRDDEAVAISSEAEYLDEVGLQPDDRYLDVLDPNGLRGARIGVVPALFGGDPDVVATVEAAIEAMERAGAVVESVTIPQLSTITGYASVSRWEFRDHLTQYLDSWPSDQDGHPRSFEEVAISLEYETNRAPSFVNYGSSGAIRFVDPDYEKNTHERSEYVRPRVLAALNNVDIEGNPLGEPYDALLYPSVQSPPVVGGPPQSGSNNRLSSFTGFPALSMPAGFTVATPERVALPIGMEMLGREFHEATLLRLAYGYQEAVEGTPLARQAPKTTPEL